MLHATGERTLEKYKVFPFIAWATFVGFAIFVYAVTLELRQASDNLKESTTQLEAIVKTQDITKVENFDIR